MFRIIRKILLVTFLTALIWFWADQALNRVLPDVPATVRIAKSSDPQLSQLWISFEEEDAAPVKLRISGPASRVGKIERRLTEEGSLRFDLYINPLDENITTVGTHVVDVEQIAAKSRIINDLGVQIDAVDPKTLTLEVKKLVKQNLAVQVFNENQTQLRNAIVDPAMVEMYVPQNWQGDALKAKVILSPQEIEQAKITALRKHPRIELAPNALREAETAVKITMPAGRANQQEYKIESTSVGIALSQNQQGKCSAQITNMAELLRAIKIQATSEAMDAYQAEPFKMILEITDDEAAKSGEQTKELKYNLPENYVAKDEITVVETEPRIAKFQIVPSSGAVTAPAP